MNSQFFVIADSDFYDGKVFLYNTTSGQFIVELKNCDSGKYYGYQVAVSGNLIAVSSRGSNVKRGHVCIFDDVPSFQRKININLLPLCGKRTMLPLKKKHIKALSSK